MINSMDKRSSQFLISEIDFWREPKNETKMGQIGDWREDSFCIGQNSFNQPLLAFLKRSIYYPKRQEPFFPGLRIDAIFYIFVLFLTKAQLSDSHYNLAASVQLGCLKGFKIFGNLDISINTKFSELIFFRLP